MFERHHSHLLGFATLFALGCSGGDSAEGSDPNWRPDVVFDESLDDLGVVTTATVDQNGATEFDRCPIGHLCLFTGPDGTGTMVTFRFPSYDLRRPVEGLVFDNRFASVWNRTQTVTWWLFPEPRLLGNPIQAVGIDVRQNLTFPNIVSSLSHSH